MTARKAETAAPKMEETAVALPGSDKETALARPEDLEGFTGMEDLDHDQFIIPRVKIIQPTSKKGTAGKLMVNLTGEEFAEILILPIKVTQGRVFWEEGGDSEKPICRSPDGHRPDPRIEEPQNEICIARKELSGGRVFTKIVCPRAVWGPDGSAPECRQVFNLLCLDLEQELPFWISVSGASITPLRNFLSVINIRRRPLWEFYSSMGLEERTQPHRHFVLTFSPPHPADKETMVQVIDIVRSLKAETIERTFEAEEELEKRADEDGANAPGWMEGQDGGQDGDDIPL